MVSERTALLGTLTGAAFWGLSGTAAQAVFQGYGFPVVGLVTIRMLVSGAILFLIVRPRFPRDQWKSLLLLAIFGFLGIQLAYLLAIAFSNAVTATLLQFLFLPIVVAYEMISGVHRWSWGWGAILGLAMIGTVFLVGGVPGLSFHFLVTIPALAFGLLSAVCAAYYTLGSRSFVRTHGSWWVTTWGFLLGGLVSAPLGGIQLVDYRLPPTGTGLEELGLLLVFIILFGTVLGYGLFLSGLRRLSATEIGVAAAAEPVVAAGATYAFLGVALGPVQYVGGGLIVVAVVMLAFRSPSPSPEGSREASSPGRDPPSGRLLP